MLPKHKNPANVKDCPKCAICSQKVTSGEDEALFCIGKCSWMHRYCARVSLTHYKELSSESAGCNSLCLTCSQQSYETTVKELKETIKN